MAEGKSVSVDELLKQIEDFENTIRELMENTKSLKQKILKNKETYGSDVSKWPKEK